MSGPGGRSYGNTTQEPNENRFAISAQFARLSRLDQVISTIQPLVAQSDNIPFRSYARRFFPLNNTRSNNHRQEGRSVDMRPQNDETLREQSSSNNTSSNSSPVPQSPTVVNAPSAVPNVVINIDLEPYIGNNDSNDGNNSNSSQNSIPDGEQNQLGTLSIDSNNLEEFIGRHQDLRIPVIHLWQYIVFVCIVLVKLLFDKITSIFAVVFLCLIFTMGDEVLKKKATDQNRSLKSIVAILFIMPITIYLLYRTYNKENFFYSAILLFPDYNLLTLGELLWIVIVTDFVLKLVTITLKSFVVILPRSLINQRSKANVYALLERISRLYRSLATVQPWLSYFLDGYIGPKKIFGVFLSAFYILCKGPETITRIKELRSVISKVVYSSSYGSNPSQSELDESGGKCPICHDDFTSPLRLTCTHIFCESCVLTWFSKERTCPMCRTNIVTEDTSYRDGSTSILPQIY